jgi:hypothetical protein
MGRPGDIASGVAVSPGAGFMIGRLRQQGAVRSVREHAVLSPARPQSDHGPNLLSLYRNNEMPFHLKKAVKNALTRDEIIGTITYLAFYAGWPPATTAVFEEFRQ